MYNGYSPEAENILPLFDIDANNIRVFLEGKDDIPFWEYIFKDSAPKQYKIIFDPKGGQQELYKLLDDLNGKHDFIVALDSDYDEIIHHKKKYKNNLSIFTKKYSIENYLFCAFAINKIIEKIYGNTEKNNIKDIIQYTQTLSEKLEQLLYLDCKRELCKLNEQLKTANPELFQNKLKLIGGNNSIEKFLTSGYIPSDKKIKQFIDSNNLSNTEIDSIKKLFANKNLYDFLNGHFIKSSIIKYIKQYQTTKNNIKTQDLYNNAYDCCINCSEDCEYQNIKTRAKEVVNNLIQELKTK